ncbi:MAG: hypothetical protein AAGJ18_10835 [Bacteroidota bacterium]
MNIQDVNNDGIAMDGFDPVAHYNGEPLRGQAQFSFQIGDYTYHFANKENLKKFEEMPQRYLPIVGNQILREKEGIEKIGQSTPTTTKLTNRRNLEDTPVSNEVNVPIDIKEDGSVEMQNLSDDHN